MHIQAAPLADLEFIQLLQDMLGDLQGDPEPIEVKIFGDDPVRLAELAAPVEEMLNKVDGVVDVVGVQEGNPEVTWTIDPVAAGRYGLTVEQVSDQMAGNWLGEVATELRLADRTIPVRVRLPDSFRFTPDRLPTTLLRAADGKVLPVSAVATMERANGQGELRRENLRPMAVVSGRLEGRDLGSAVAEIRQKLDEMNRPGGGFGGAGLPVGYTYEIGGQYQSQRQAFRELLIVFALAVLLVFTILVVQFRSWTPALLILLAAPLSVSGALLLLWLADIELNISSAMGLILLVGLVVKNGIMLLDVSEKRHADGESFHLAIAHAGTCSSAADLDDDVLHAVRTAAARAGTRRRRRAAATARPRGHRRACLVDAGNAAGDSRRLCGAQTRRVTELPGPALPQFELPFRRPGEYPSPHDYSNSCDGLRRPRSDLQCRLHGDRRGRAQTPARRARSERLTVSSRSPRPIRSSCLRRT